MTDKKHCEALRILLCDVKYELSPGIHTYHTCQYCGKYSTRRGKCAICLVKDFKETCNGKTKDAGI